MIDKVGVGVSLLEVNSPLWVLIVTTGRRETFMERAFPSRTSFNPDDSFQSMCIVLHHRWGREELECLQDQLVHEKAWIGILVPGLSDLRAHTRSSHMGRLLPWNQVQAQFYYFCRKFMWALALCVSREWQPPGDTPRPGSPTGPVPTKLEMAFTPSFWTKDFILWITVDYVELNWVYITCGSPTKKWVAKMRL